MSNFFSKIKEFFLKYEIKIVLIVGFCLISAISFEFGFLQGQKWTQKPLIIEKPAATPQTGEIGQKQPSADSGKVQATTQSKIGAQTSNSGCAYVGSKNSNKFYLPTCSYAKRIKPENVVCFKNAQQATEQGRTESKCK